MNTTQETKSPVTQKITVVTKDTKVFDIVDQYPETLQVFLDFGFSQMANPVMRNTMGRVASIEMATKMHNVDMDKFLKALNDKIVSKKWKFFKYLLNVISVASATRSLILHKRSHWNLSHSDPLPVYMKL